MNCNYAAQLINAHKRRSTAAHVVRDLLRGIDHAMNCRCPRCALSIRVLNGDVAPGTRLTRVRRKP